MSLSEYKITDAQIAQKGVIEAPDKLTGTAAQNKALFDRLIREVVKDEFNGLIDALEASTAAANLGAKDANGNDSTVQDELDELSGAKVRLFTISGSSDLETAQAAYDFLQSGGFPVLKELAGVPRFFVYSHKKTESGKEYFYFDRTDNLSGPMGDGDTAFYHDCRALIVEDGAVTQIQFNMAVVARYLSTYGLTEQSEAFVPTVPAHPATKKYVDGGLEEKYEKPSGGIPKSDLASAVKASLAKADSALQSVPNTYRTSAAQDVIDSEKMDKVNPSGTGSFSLNRSSAAEIGEKSFAAGDSVRATGRVSHAEGFSTEASGYCSHAEGFSTEASGNDSHAEGGATTAGATYAHAEGCGSKANGMASHAEGDGTKASSDYQHVQGRYNVEDAAGTYADIVGGGSGESSRKNIEATTKAGDKRLKGDVYVGCNDDSTGGTKLVPVSVSATGSATDEVQYITVGGVEKKLAGGGGTPGADGVTFTPSVDASGNISWTNDGGKENPTTRNIRGPQGPQGTAGADGADGITPTIGENGNWYLGDTDTGKPSRGVQGEQGVQGPKGDTGAAGAAGAAGKSAYASARDGGYTGTETQFNRDLADVSGKQDTISDLADIRSGAAAGAAAYQKPSGGIPKTDLESAVQSKLDDVDTLMTTAPIIPVVSQSEMVDRSKSYLLNGHIWRWETRMVQREITVEIQPKACIIQGKRYSHGGASFVDAPDADTLMIPVHSSGASDIFNVRQKNPGAAGVALVRHTSWTGLYYGSSNSLFPNSFTLADNLQIVSATIVSQGEQFLCFMLQHVSSYSGLELQVNGVDMEYEVSATPSARQRTTETRIITEEVSDYFDTEIVYGAGKSAYQIALDNGFVGTEAEWLASLRIPANIVQETGSSTTSVMSQKAVTDALIGVARDGMAQHIGRVFAPAQKPADGSQDADVNLASDATQSADIDAMLAPIVSRYPHYVTRTLLGKDASGAFDIYRYTLGKHYYAAFCKRNYPKMYGWKHGDTTIYSLSVSPRMGDALYSTPYISTTAGEVTAVSATNRTRTVGGAVYTRSAASDVEPTLVYNPIYRGAGLEDRLYRLQNGEMYFAATKRTVTASEIEDTNGVIYDRYPLGDLDGKCMRRIPIVIIANEHGGYEPRDPALVSARLVRDLCCDSCQENTVLRWLKENASLTVITCVNPFGWNKYNDAWAGYRNANRVNINRNYDTPGWDVYGAAHPDEDASDFGAYPGSEIETQYVMNAIAESGAAIAISIHGIGRTANLKTVYYQGQNPRGGYDLSKIGAFREDYFNRYGLTLEPYNPLATLPEDTAKSPSYITQSGAIGGLIEFNANDAQIDEGGAGRRYTSWTMEQQYTLLLKFLAMWISDYEDAANE